MAMFGNWMDSNALRSYPIDDKYSCDIPYGFISDMLIFAPVPRNADIDDSTDKLLVRDLPLSDFTFPKIHSAAVTGHLATVVVECDRCKLFCTKPLDSIVPYEPVEFVSENGLCSGWMSFGSFDKSIQFSFKSSGDEGRLDPMAVVLYPSSTIGHMSIPGFPAKLSGRVKISGGNGIAVSADKDTNSIVLSLDDDLSNLYSDPCNRDSSPDAPPVCGVSGVSPRDGIIVLAFTGKKMSDNDVDRLLYALENYDIGQNQFVETESGFYRESRDDGTVHDYIAVTVQAVSQSTSSDSEFEIVGYRLSYGITDPETLGLAARDMEFSAGTGYHRPQYDVWTRKDFLPPLAELYRKIYVDDIDMPVSVINDDPWDDDSDANRLREHVYEANHISSRRYDIENSTVISGSGNHEDDPYDFGSKVVHAGEKIVFLHRIRDLVPFDMISSIFVDVAYRPAGSDLISVVRRNIYVARDEEAYE